MARGGGAKMCEARKFVFIVFAFLILTALAGVSAAKTIYVPDDYARIQRAVDNASAGDTIIVRDGIYYENLEVDKQLTIKSENGSDNCIIDGGGIGNVITLNANGITIEGFTVRNSGSYVSDAGIKVVSNANIIKDNKIINSSREGIFITGSNNTIMRNYIYNSGDYGIWLLSSSNNSIIENDVIYTHVDGIILVYGSNNNIISNNNISYSRLHSCLHGWGCGIRIGMSEGNKISHNIISNNNGHGIYLQSSTNNTQIWNNNITNSGCYGIFIESETFRNIIYLNNFINNTYQVSSFSSTNIWNSTEKITYTYKGKTYENYLGNYWNDYNGSDANGDGIGDIPYIIDSDKDNYPLIEGFENYFVPTPTPTPAQIFDTGRPENPYPSISGEFIGTIKTNTKIIATKLYTYACEGTGGHTEHAIICNRTWCAEAKWEGYKEDWMNISFNRTVVLMPYETYNITIVTGSYPQIHHTSSLKTENGWMNCTEFTDANGKKYDDWIPAIKLW